MFKKNCFASDIALSRFVRLHKFLKRTYETIFSIKSLTAVVCWSFMKLLHWNIILAFVREAPWIKKDNLQENVSNIKSCSLPAHKCVSISKAIQTVQGIAHVKNARLLVKDSTRNSYFIPLASLSASILIPQLKYSVKNTKRTTLAYLK